MASLSPEAASAAHHCLPESNSAICSGRLCVSVPFAFRSRALPCGTLAGMGARPLRGVGPRIRTCNARIVATPFRPARCSAMSVAPAPSHLRRSPAAPCVSRCRRAILAAHRPMPRLSPLHPVCPVQDRAGQASDPAIHNKRILLPARILRQVGHLPAATDRDRGCRREVASPGLLPRSVAKPGRPFHHSLKTLRKCRPPPTILRHRGMLGRARPTSEDQLPPKVIHRRAALLREDLHRAAIHHQAATRPPAHLPPPAPPPVSAVSISPV